MQLQDGRQRVVIQGVAPEVDAGRFPIKRIEGDIVVVEADAFTDGHDLITCRLLYRKRGENGWQETPMTPLPNDRWRGSFRVAELGRYQYTVVGWIDRFATWRRDLAKKLDAGQETEVDLLIGADLLEAVAERASGPDKKQFESWSAALRSGKALATRIELALSDAVADLVAAHPDRAFAVRHPRELEVVVDREKAGFSAWYEFFPRSQAAEDGRHGTFRDAIRLLPELAEMGFDILYLPPIHPIGKTKRKGPNNRPAAAPDDPGSPWAIGSAEGGHKSIHPELGTLKDFRDFVAEADRHGLEVALDLAFQCSPDHPYVQEHPEWFLIRPDGTVQFAENPPKKYEDIYPFNFETESWRELWDELKSVVEFWIEQGVLVFRVDNPHTKPFAFWEWLIGEIKERHPEVIFLSEAFTRPKVMYRLAKLGFSQSYTYFAWRNSSWDLRDYLLELTRTEVRDYFRPNFWPNTPDILTEYLQLGGRPAFMTRLVLAATLGASYGIYGPAFELAESRARHYGSEEYLDSEKYQVRKWDRASAIPMRDFITRMNRIRRENAALQRNDQLSFHSTSNDQLLCYSKRTADHANVVLVVVNLDPYHTQSGWIDLDPEALGIQPQEGYQVHDLVSEARFLWHGARNYVELNPHSVPAHIFRLRRRVRSEQDFEYYL